MGWLSEPFSFFFSRSQSCCDSIHYFLPIGQSDGYFFFVLHTQSLAGEEEAANSYTKKWKPWLGRGETRDLADQDTRGHQEGQQDFVWEKTYRKSCWGIGEEREKDCGKKGVNMPSFQDFLPCSVLITGEPIFYTAFAEDTKKEA